MSAHGARNPLAAAVLDALGDDLDAQRALADLLGPYIAEQSTPRQADERWLSTRHAADYLGMTPNALHKLTAARKIPFEQDVPGGKCWFKRSDLDAWRGRP